MESIVTVEEFNAKYPIGTPVMYQPIKGVDEWVRTKTRSKAWVLGHGQIVVMIGGRSGGCCISHMVVIPDTEEAPK